MCNLFPETAFNKSTSSSPARLFAVMPYILAAVIWFMPQTLFAQEKSGQEVTEASYASFNGMSVKAIKIEPVDCPWCTDQVKQLARDLINLQEKVPFTELKFRQSLEDLKLSKWFEDISPSLERSGDGVIVTFILKPNFLIKDIRTEGEYPLFKSEVMKAMSVAAGDPLLSDTIEKQEKLIVELYRREGYLNPVVHIATDMNWKDGTVIPDVVIEPGPYYSLSALRIKGNKSMLLAEIKSRMNVWRSSFFIRESRRFRETELQQDIKDLTNVYRQRGYAECEIHYTVSKDEKTRTVEVEIAISEGPLYEMSITGNHWFWAFTLKKDIVIFKQGNRRDSGLRKTIENMKQRYRTDGYLFTEIVPLEEKITHKGKTVRKIDLSITEGPRTQVESIKFIGNRAFTEDRLKDAMQTGKGSLFKKGIYNPDTMDKDLAAIRTLYLDNGYTDMKISNELTWNEQKTSVAIAVTVSEGVQTLVSTLKIDGLHVFNEEKALNYIQLHQGKPFRESFIKADESSLADAISEKGRPYVAVKADTSFSKEHSGVDIVFHVDEGPYVAVGDIYYRGNFRTKKRVLDKELGLKTGDPFSLKGTLAGQKNIRDMEIFDSVQFKTFGLKEKRDHTTLLIDMDEAKPFYVQGGAGYMSDRGLYGNAGVGDRNLFGLNKDAKLGGEVSQIGYKGELDITQRRILGTPITSLSVLSYEKQEDFHQSFGTSVWTYSLSFLRELKPQHLKTSLGIRYEHRDVFVTGTLPEDFDISTLQPRGILVTTPFISYDTRDSFVRPKEGVFSSFSVDVSKGLQNSLDNFLKYNYNIRYYFSPAQWITLAWLGRLGLIDPYGTASNIPEDQLFYLGGTLSVRGFEENLLRFDASRNPVGGRVAMVGSMEARFDLTPEWEGSIFYDTGSVRKALVDEGSDKFRSSVGVGVRYITPIGPIGLLYGYKLHPEAGESPGRIHFSIGYTF